MSHLSYNSLIQLHVSTNFFYSHRFFFLYSVFYLFIFIFLVILFIYIYFFLLFLPFIYFILVFFFASVNLLTVRDESENTLEIYFLFFHRCVLVENLFCHGTAYSNLELFRNLVSLWEIYIEKK